MPYSEPQCTGKWHLYLAKTVKPPWVDGWGNFQDHEELTWKIIAESLDRADACDLAMRLLLSPMYCAARLVEERTERKWADDPPNIGSDDKNTQ